MTALRALLLVGLLQTVLGQTCDRCEEKTRNGMGYLLCNCKKTWDDANQYCREVYQGQLAVITDQSLQDMLFKLLDKSSALDTWIGLRGKSGDWNWVTGQVNISSQGCFQDDPVDKDLNFQVQINDVTPEKCITGCRNAGYRYAGVQSGILCNCDNTFGSYGFSSECTQPCLGDFNQNCGGTSSNQIFLVDGIWSGGWAFGSPSGGSGGIDDMECMVYKCESESQSWRWQSERCARKFKYICMYDYDKSKCQLEGLTSTAEACISYDEYVEDTWFGSRSGCFSKGGRLLEITSKTSHDAIRAVLPCAQRIFWLGATKINWQWANGDALAFAPWAGGVPSNEGEKCVAMSYKVSITYEWSDLGCKDQQSFICERPLVPTQPTTLSLRTTTTTPPDIIPATTTTSTTTTTTATSTTSTTTTRSTPSTESSSSSSSPTSSTTTSTTTTTPYTSTTTPTTGTSITDITSTTTAPPIRPPWPSVTSVSVSPASGPTMSTVSSTPRTHKPTHGPVVPGPTREPGVPVDPGLPSVDPGVTGDPDTTKPGATSDTTITDDKEAGERDWIPIYVGIAVAILLFLVIVLVTIWKCCKMCRKKKEQILQQPSRLENGYTNRAGFVADTDFAYSGANGDKQQSGHTKAPAPHFVETKRNGLDKAPYVAVVPNNAILHDKHTPVSVVSPNSKLAGDYHLRGLPEYDEKQKDYPDFPTVTATSGSSEGVPTVDRSDATSVSSSSSAYIGELDDAGVKYVHPRGESMTEHDDSSQPDISTHYYDSEHLPPSQTSTVDARPVSSHENVVEMGEKRNPRRGDLYYSDIDVSTRL